MTIESRTIAVYGTAMPASESRAERLSRGARDDLRVERHPSAERGAGGVNRRRGMLAVGDRMRVDSKPKRIDRLADPARHFALDDGRRLARRAIRDSASDHEEKPNTAR